MPYHDRPIVAKVKSRPGLMNRKNDVSRPRARESNTNHSIKEHQEEGTQNRATELEEFGLKPFLISCPVATDGSSCLVVPKKVKRVGWLGMLYRVEVSVTKKQWLKVQGGGYRGNKVHQKSFGECRSKAQRDLYYDTKYNHFF